MFGLSQLEERLIWIAIVLGVIVAFAWHERRLGAANCERADMQAAVAQKAAIAAQKAADDQRLQEAYNAYAIELAGLQRARTTEPAPHLVCHQTGSRPVSPAAAVSSPAPSGAGALPTGDGPSFDPAPAARGIADEADELLAACRRLNSSVTH